MPITDMSQESVNALLLSMHVGWIACVRDSRPYVTPLNVAYQDHCIYGFATLGKRIQWMRAIRSFV